jgi:hypothetical protein
MADKKSDDHGGPGAVSESTRNRDGPAASGSLERWGNRIIRARLFVVSYAPLALIFALRSIEDNRLASVLWCGIAILGFLDGLWILRRSHRRGAVSVTFSRIDDAGGSVAGYLATYLLPLLGTSINGAPILAAYAVYFVVLFLVYTNSDMAFVNPTLYLYRRRVVLGVLTSGAAKLVICKEPPADNIPVNVVEFLGVLLVADRPIAG